MEVCGQWCRDIFISNIIQRHNLFQSFASIGRVDLVEYIDMHFLLGEGASGPLIIVLSMPPLVKHGLHVWAECRQQHNSASITRTLVGLGKWSLITHSLATELLTRDKLIWQKLEFIYCHKNLGLNDQDRKI